MIHQLFPSFVYQEKSSLSSKFISELVEEALKIKDSDRDGQLWSLKNYPGGFTSYGSIDQLHLFSSSFFEVEKELRKHVYKFAKKLDMEISKENLKISSFWINLMPPGCMHSMHIHPLSALSGTLYLKTPKGSSPLKFEDPRLVQFMASPPRKFNSHPRNQRFISVTPKSGDIVLFESWMKHEVPLNTSQDLRISASFNYDFVNSKRL